MRSPAGRARSPGSPARCRRGELLSLEARCDSALVWALVLHRLRAGDGAGPALAEAVSQLAAAAPGSRLNLLLTDGRITAATAWGDSLWYLPEPGNALALASEPYDDDPRLAPDPDAPARRRPAPMSCYRPQGVPPLSSRSPLTRTLPATTPPGPHCAPTSPTA